MITFNNKVVTYNHKWINGNGTPSPITSYNYQVDWIWNLTTEDVQTYNVRYTSSAQQFNMTPFSQYSNYPGYAYYYIPAYACWSEVGAQNPGGTLIGVYSSSEYTGNSVMKFVYNWSLDTPANRRVIVIYFTNLGVFDIPANKFTMRVTNLNTSQVITSWNNSLIEVNGTEACFISLSNYE